MLAGNSTEKEARVSPMDFAEYKDDMHERTLTGVIADLFSAQMAQWPQLRTAYEVLRQTREREIKCDGFNVRLRHNSLRAKSTTANVDEKSIAARPCFLCMDNLPNEQQSILYRGKYRILCNPMPAFERHVTIAAVEHCPQSIEGNSRVFFQLMEDLGSGWTVLYNGPRCGASAPDHNHFQAIPSGLLPIEGEIAAVDQSRLKDSEMVRLYSAEELGRHLIFLRGSNKEALQAAFEGFLTFLKKDVTVEVEAMVNVAGRKNGDEFHVFVFPRSKHRPEAYFLTGHEKITVSPAVIEMCGVIVTPVELDFERLTGKQIEAIYREVSLRTNMAARE